MSWTRRRFLAASSLTLAAAAGWPVASARAGRRDGVFTPLRRGVGYYTNRGGTIGYLATGEALVMVDAQYPETASAAWDGLHEQTGRRIDVLLNTHHHGDHTAGNVALQPHAEQIVAHETVPTWQRRSAEARGNADAQAYATTTFPDAWVVDLGDETVRATHYGRAHTSGDAVIHFVNADVVHMGDLVFNRMPAFIDRDAGATIHGWMDLLERVHADYTDETQFIFGHGSADYGVTGRRADLLVMRDFLGGLLAFAAEGLHAGQSADEVAETKRLPDFPEHYAESWPEGIANGLRVAYAELSEGGP